MRLDALTLFGLVAVSAMLASCSATEKTASPWTNAPSGQWQTRIARWDTAGPGNNYLAETVQIKRANADGSVDLLTLEENSGPAKIKLWWRDPVHLVIGYDNGSVIFKQSRSATCSWKLSSSTHNQSVPRLARYIGHQFNITPRVPTINYSMAKSGLVSKGVRVGSGVSHEPAYPTYATITIEQR